MAEKEKKEYTPSAQTDQARQDALDHGSRKPGAYVSKWQQMLDAAMEKILNREKFSYDLNGDALYRQYKDQAVKNGRSPCWTPWEPPPPSPGATEAAMARPPPSSPTRDPWMA